MHNAWHYRTGAWIRNILVHVQHVQHLQEAMQQKETYVSKHFRWICIVDLDGDHIIHVICAPWRFYVQFECLFETGYCSTDVLQVERKDWFHDTFLLQRKDFPSFNTESRYEYKHIVLAYLNMDTSVWITVLQGKLWKCLIESGPFPYILEKKNRMKTKTISLDFCEIDLSNPNGQLISMVMSLLGSNGQW